MDLKDITRGLRGDDEDAPADDETGEATGSRSPPSAVASDRHEPSGDDTSSAGADREDAHVCPFCETEFDPDRGACPECDAEIVLRGTR
ncbi:hypothetical protein [Halorussus sp. AFM4]|uniref:hypothetical protein n=1 Tax=Halorussus sp. AFM4 TaxID=3421651 RepID=UPI003EBE8073